MLIGQYTHTLDEKKRLSLPSRFRKELGKNVVLTPGLDGCLFLFSSKAWKEISIRLGESSMLQSDARSFNRYMFGGAVEVELDSAGRILIPDFLIGRVALKTRAVIVGVQTRIEIWNEKAWQKYNAGVESRADTLAERLGTIGIL